MIKSIFTFHILVVVFFFFSCTKDAQQISSTESFALTSPNGFQLANDFNSLTKKVGYGESADKPIVVENVKYFETASYSFAVVDYTIDGAFVSALIQLHLDDGYLLFSDKHDVYVVKKTGHSGIKSDDQTITIDLDSEKKPDMVINCQGSNRCSWTQPSPNHMHCGCDIAK